MAAAKGVKTAIRGAGLILFASGGCIDASLILSPSNRTDSHHLSYPTTYLSSVGVCTLMRHGARGVANQP